MGVRRIFLTIFWLISVGNDFIHLEDIIFSTASELILYHLLSALCEFFKFPLPAAPSAALAAPVRHSLPRA